MNDQMDTGLKNTPVYRNTLMLEPEDGMAKVVEELGAWITWKTSEELTAEMILSGRESFTFMDDSELMIELGQFEGIESAIPMEIKAIYVHDDPRVDGRQWVTEVLIEREMSDYVVKFTLNLSVMDADHEARKPMPSRPRLMLLISESCRPIISTPGLYAKPLTVEASEKFLNEVNNLNRQVPIVLVSRHHHTTPAIRVDRISEHLLGLVSLYQVERGVDGRALEQALGKANSCYGDAIRIIWPIEEGEENVKSMVILSKDKNGKPRSLREMESLAVSIVLRNRAALL